MPNIATFAFYIAAAVAEISGSFAFWAWLRLGKSALWAIPGTAMLILFAILLTRVDVAYAGRVFAAYGGVYVVSSLGWLWAVEGTRPDRWDGLGGMIILAGAAIVLLGPRTT